MSKQNRDSKDFVKLEYSVLDLTEYNGLTINGNMKLLLSMVYSYDKVGRTYWESVGTIGKRCGCKPEAVRNFRNKLRDAGMITFEEEKGSTHKISPVELDPSLMVFLDDHNSTQVSNRKVETEESGKNEQKPVVESFVVESAAPVVEQTGSVPVVDVPVDADLPAGDHAVNAHVEYTDEQKRTKLRKWRNWGLDEEAKDFCLSHGVSNDEDSMKLFIQNYHIPVPAPVEQQVNATDDYSPPDFDSIPF
ncbi:helix-turn-helix domain-containing protein [Scandinavium manionii]|uniref:helix-turn-helix domain-containing protein n=1 Tax=Scandinavium manionii TaxID=2926520 RepID=UPI0021668FF9|nr:helix-turn-helix domain-containing protein [Scandinavium manionii]MCS2164989.1 helix-turn-helix domain-containing protein [Scandinavium manionii]